MAQIRIDAGNVVNTFSNTDVNVIAITEDKLVNILTVHVIVRDIKNEQQG